VVGEVMGGVVVGEAEIQMVPRMAACKMAVLR